MKPNAQDLIGKTISAVIIKTSDRPPKSQLFYSADGIHPTGGPDPGDLQDVLECGRDRTTIVFAAYPRRGF